MEADFLPPPLDPGQRLIIAGQTGSGKSEALTWALYSQRLRGIILDTKQEPSFKRLPKTSHADGLENADVSILGAPDGPDFLIVQPSPAEITDTDGLDDFLLHVYESCENVVIGVDELYNVAQGSTPGAGITALYTRGRSRRLSVIAATQRPVWVPLFCLSEASQFYVFSLSLPQDRARLASLGSQDLLDRPLDKYRFWWFKIGSDIVRLSGPVPLRAPPVSPRPLPPKHFERVRLI